MNPPPSSRIRIRKHSSTVITNFTSFVYCCAKVLESFVSSLCLFACLCILIRPSMCFCVSTSFAHNFIIAFSFTQQIMYKNEPMLKIVLLSSSLSLTLKIQFLHRNNELVLAQNHPLSDISNFSELNCILWKWRPCFLFKICVYCFSKCYLDEHSEKNQSKEGVRNLNNFRGIVVPDLD